jgi:hypothetical protein
MIVFVAGSTPLATPVITAVAVNPTTPGGGDGGINVSWAGVANADHYVVEHATGADAVSGWVTDASNVSGNSYGITGLTAGSYSVGVTAIPA